MYVKNKNPTEDMDAFNFWLGTDSVPTDTTIKWGFDSSTPTSGAYHYSPSFVSTGSNKDETVDSAPLQLSTFTLCAWFKTTAAPSPDEGFFVNKGGMGVDTPGENQNYGLWMQNNGTIRGGFETGAGTDNFVTSPLTYHNGVWHFALIYYSGTALNLYVDNMSTPVATLATTSTPETNTKPVRINQNSRANSGWMPAGAEIDQVRVWNRALTDEDERTALMEEDAVNETGLVLDKDFGDADFNLVAQTIPDVYTAPTGVTWHDAGPEPTIPNIGRLRHGMAVPIWVWWHVEAGAITRKDDAATFNFSFLVPGGGTGDPGTPPGGGSGGGSVTFDDFGIRQIYATKSGGRKWSSNWHTATSHEWSPADSDHDYGVNLDPQDNMVDLICNNENKVIVDSVTKTLQCDTETDGNNVRLWIKDPAATETSSPWKWSESTESTIYYKVIASLSGSDIHVPCRLHGPGEHWLAIAHCPAGGHEYGFEIKANKVIQLRKEVAHKASDPDCYCTNIESTTEQPFTPGVWVGMKLVTIQESTGRMRIEGWRDMTDGFNGGTWEKMVSMIDDGTTWPLTNDTAVDFFNGLPSGSGNCVKLSPMNKALDMDGSAVGVRCDGTRVQYKKYTVREIEPTDPGSGGSGGSTGGGGSGGGSGGNPPPGPTEYKIAFCGDWGCEKATDNVISLIKSQGYDYVVGVGDNAYASSSCWTSRFATLKPNFNSAYGNHEYSESGGINPYKTFFAHNLTYFTFKFQNIQFFVADTNINCDPGSTQHNFIKSALETSHNDSTVKWRIAIMHHQWFSTQSSHSNNEFDQVQAFHQLFMTHGVAFVIVGHLHNWSRTHQVAYNAGNPENPTPLSTTSPYTVTTSGLIHVITGTGGHDSGSSLYGQASQPAFVAYQNRTHNGVWEIVASNNGLTFNCAFREIGGETFDEFVISTS
jgi:concanavalin A-like lectin/glucanase superfamily protein/calcineurin-like phosphoesterase family protein